MMAKKINAWMVTCNGQIITAYACLDKKRAQRDQRWLTKENRKLGRHAKYGLFRIEVVPAVEPEPKGPGGYIGEALDSIGEQRRAKRRAAR